jgi:hypothetical protein
VAKLDSDLSEVNRAEHEFRILTAGELPPLDRSDYDALHRDLSAQGFRHLGFLEDLTLSRVYPEERTYVAMYVSADHRVTAATWRLSNGQSLEFETVMLDGRALITSNAQPDKLAPPPGVDKLVLAAGTAPEILLTRHGERLAAFQRRDPEAGILRIDDVNAFLASVKRYSRAAVAHRRSVGLVTLDEMVSLAANDRERRSARVIWKEIQRRWSTDRQRSERR